MPWKVGGSDEECPCIFLHTRCDPTTCDKAAAARTSREGSLTASLDRLQMRGAQGCETCATLYAGIKGSARSKGLEWMSTVDEEDVGVIATFDGSETSFLIQSIKPLWREEMLEFCTSQNSSE
jgi:hypothetical protein